MVGQLQVYDDDLINKIIFMLHKEKDNGFKKFLVGLKGVLTHNVGSNFLYWYAYRVGRKLKDDFDHITVISGREGVGKSTFTSKLVAMISPNCEIDHVCYKPMDLVKAFEAARPGDTVWIDEGALFLFSREAMGKSNKMLIKLLTISRQLNLHLVICIPNFFTIDTYIREHRVNALFHIIKRGKFKYFGEKVVNLVSVFGRKSKNVLSKDITVKNNIVLGDFNSYFAETTGLTKSLYDERKKLNMNEHLDELRLELAEMGEKSTGSSLSNAENNPLRGLVKTVDFAEQMGLHPQTVRRWGKEGRIKMKKIGNTIYVDTVEATKIANQES